MAQATLQKNEQIAARREQKPSVEQPDREERIRARAYELYEARHFEDGHAEDDWFRAEAEISEELGERSH